MRNCTAQAGVCVTMSAQATKNCKTPFAMASTHVFVVQQLHECSDGAVSMQQIATNNTAQHSTAMNSTAQHNAA